MTRTDKEIQRAVIAMLTDVYSRGLEPGDLHVDEAASDWTGPELERAFGIVGSLFLWYGYQSEHGNQSTILGYLQRQALLNEKEPD